MDTVFGPKFHPEFPRQLRACGSVDGSECGTYPATSEGLYNDGVDLSVQSESQVRMSQWSINSLIEWLFTCP